MTVWWRRPWVHAVAAGVLYFGIALAVLGPGALTDCSGSIFGDPGDPTGGWIWHQWNLDRLGLGPFAGSTPLSAHPVGADLWQPHFVTWVFLFVPLWLLTQVLGPVCAYNTELLAGMVLSALAMFGLVRWLTRNPVVAVLAGAVFAFSPYQQVKAAAHLPYVHVWIFPLVVWAILALWRAPSRRRAVAAGATVGLAAYIDGYYLLLVPPVAAAMFVVWLLGAVRGAQDELRRRAAATATAAVVAFAVLTPLGFTYLTSGDDVTAVVQRDARELEMFSARPWEYVVPSVYHPVWDDVIGDWRRENLHRSNFAEQTLYLGTPVLAGALTFVLATLLRRRRAVGEGDGNGEGDADRDAAADGGGTGATDGDVPASEVAETEATTSEATGAAPWAVDRRLVAWSLGAVALVGFVLSLPPWITVAGRRVPMPSRVIGAVAPLWRVFARFFIPISAAIVILAACGLAVWLARSRRPSVVLAALVPLLVFDSLSYADLGRWSYDDRRDKAYEWLADAPAGTVVAEYPLIEDIFHAHHQWYQTFQPSHGKPLLNGARWGSEFGRLTAGLTGLADPQTLPALRRLGVDLVLVHHDLHVAQLPVAERPSGITPAFEGDDVVVHEIAPGPVGSAVLGVDDVGWFRNENDAWTSRRWLSGDGEMRVFRLDGSSGEVCAGFRAASFAVPRTLRIEQDGRVLFDGEIGFERAEVSFVAQTGARILVSATPGPDRVNQFLTGSEDDREVSIEVSSLRATAGRRPCPSSFPPS